MGPLLMSVTPLSQSMTFPADYTAALQGLAYTIRTETGLLRLDGDDRLPFLDRQSTNALKSLPAGRLVPTVLTSPTARILDVLHVFADADTLVVITLPGRGRETARFLQGKVFFMDQVIVRDESAAWVQFDLLGPRLAALWEAWGLASAPGNQSAIHITHAEAGDAWLLHGNGLALQGYVLLAPAAQAAVWEAVLQAASAVALAPRHYEILRIESAMPGPATELTADYTPLEANLRFAIADNKGCYTGQEIIARQITYDKVTKTLVGLRLSAMVVPGTQLFGAEKIVGVVTSVAESPRCGPVALAYVRRDQSHRGNELHAQNEQNAITATVVTPPCPFDP